MEGSRIEDNILYPLNGGYYSPFDLTPFKGRHYVDHLLERVRNHVKEQGDGPWLTNGAKKVTGKSKAFGDASHSLSEAEPRARQIASILHHKFGVVKGDVVHFVVPGNAEMYFPIIGTWLLRGVVSPADPGLSVEVLVAQMEEANTKVVFCCLATLAKMEKVRDKLGKDIALIVMDGASDHERSLDYLRNEDDLADRPSLPEQESTEENSFLGICWSSGTTGRPKGIMLGENLFLKQFHQSGPAVVTTTCFFHLGGFMAPLNALGHGQELTFIAPEDLEDDIGVIMKVAAESSANMFTCGSHHLIQLASWDMPSDQKPAESIQMVCPLGTNVYEGIFNDLKDKFPAAFAVLEVYGQSEGGIAVAVGFDQKTLGGTRYFQSAISENLDYLSNFYPISCLGQKQLRSPTLTLECQLVQMWLVRSLTSQTTRCWATSTTQKKMKGFSARTDSFTLETSATMMKLATSTLMAGSKS